MPLFDRRRSFQGRTASGRTTPAVFTSDDLDRDLTALMQDPLYWRERDRDFADHVTRQFQRVHGPEGPAPDGDGKRRGTLEVPRLRRRPGDDRLKQPVGRDAPNRPDDVARLQRALSETGDYPFTAPRERSGVMSANLETAVTRYQRRTGLEPDGVVAPGGPTVQQIAEEAEGDRAKHDARDTAHDTAGEEAVRKLASNTLPHSKKDNSESENKPKQDTKKDDSTGCERLHQERDREWDIVQKQNETVLQLQEDISAIEKDISAILNAKDMIKDMALDQAAEYILRRYGRRIFLAYKIYDGIKLADTIRTIHSLESKRDTLVQQKVDTIREIEKRTAEVGALTDRYNACRNQPPPEAIDETAPHPPTS